MKTTIEYRLISEQRFSALETEVNKLLNEGYQLYGNPYAINDYNCQALTRETKVKVPVGALQGT
jgi:hypothetical protein